MSVAEFTWYLLGVGVGIFMGVLTHREVRSTARHIRSGVTRAWRFVVARVRRPWRAAPPEPLPRVEMIREKPEWKPAPPRTFIPGVEFGDVVTNDDGSIEVTFAASSTPTHALLIEHGDGDSVESFTGEPVWQTLPQTWTADFAVAEPMSPDLYDLIFKTGTTTPTPSREETPMSDPTKKIEKKLRKARRANALLKAQLDASDEARVEQDVRVHFLDRENTRLEQEAMDTEEVLNNLREAVGRPVAFHRHFGPSQLERLQLAHGQLSDVRFMLGIRPDIEYRGMHASNGG